MRVQDPPRRLVLIALAGSAVFIACLLTLHILTFWDLPWYMSEYANSPYRLLFWAGGYAFVLAIVSLAVSLRPTMPSGRLPQLAVLLLLLAAPFGFLATTFSVDEGGQSSVEGQVHDLSTIPLFLFTTTAMLLLAPAFYRHPEWRPMATMTLALGVLAGIAEFAYVAGRILDEPLVGWAQRLLVGAIVAWFAGLAAWLARTARRRAAAAEPTVRA